MPYEVQTIEKTQEIDVCRPFSISHYQWRSAVKPTTYGRLALLRNQGLYVSITCEEDNPKRDCREYQVNLCQDSVIEAFFAFTGEGGIPQNNDMYINYEMNANGMLYAKYGAGRKNRQFISDELYKKSACTAYIEEKTWTVNVLIPRELLEFLGVWDNITNGVCFYCNFYKMSECPEIEHYAGYRPLKSETPNFHLPACFGKAQVVGLGY